MKTIVMRKKGRDNCLHVETPLGIVYITIGLRDMRGREVESIEVIPARYEDRKIVRRGYCNTRLILLERRG